MVPSTSQVPQPLPRVLYSLHIDDEEPISCVVRIRDNGADMVLIRSRHDTPWRMRINSSYSEDVVWKVGMGMLAGFSPQWSMKLIDPWTEKHPTTFCRQRVPLDRVWQWCKMELQQWHECENIRKKLSEHLPFGRLYVRVGRDRSAFYV